MLSMTKKKHFTGLINVLLMNPFQTQGSDYKLLELNFTKEPLKSRRKKSSIFVFCFFKDLDILGSISSSDICSYNNEN